MTLIKGHVVFKIQYVYSGYNLILLNPIYVFDSVRPS